MLFRVTSQKNHSVLYSEKKKKRKSSFHFFLIEYEKQKVVSAQMFLSFLRNRFSEQRPLNGGRMLTSRGKGVIKLDSPGNFVNKNGIQRK